jgi:hypothetical protein
MYGSVLVIRLFEERTSELNYVKNRVFVCLSYVRSWHYWFFLSIVLWKGRVVLKLRQWWVSLFQVSVWVTLFCLVFCVVVELRTYYVECLNYIWHCVIKCNPTLVGQCLCKGICVNLLLCCISFNKVFHPPSWASVTRCLVHIPLQVTHEMSLLYYRMHLCSSHFCKSNVKFVLWIVTSNLFSEFK